MLRLLAAGLALLGAEAAFAHAETGVAGGLTSGLLHPVVGVDHLLAMVAVGLWGAQLGRPALYLLPIAFPAVMALGALAGVAGLPLPGIEIGVSLSALVLGLLVLLRIVPPLWLALAVVAAFAIWHGYAHGVELPSAVNPLAYGVGFVVATGLLHLCGIGIGSLHRFSWGQAAVRTCGAGIAGFGAVFLVSALIG